MKQDQINNNGPELIGQQDKHEFVHVNSINLGDMLSDDEVAALAKPLLAVAQSWSAREREGQL